MCIQSGTSAKLGLHRNETKKKKQNKKATYQEHSGDPEWRWCSSGHLVAGPPTCGHLLCWSSSLAASSTPPLPFAGHHRKLKEKQDAQHSLWWWPLSMQWQSNLRNNRGANSLRYFKRVFFFYSFKTNITQWICWWNPFPCSTHPETHKTPDP